MPPKCCVPGCTSNYDSTDIYVSVFKFPSDVELREMWIKCIPRRGWTPTKSSVVCIKHFQSSDTIVSDKYTDKDGVEHVIPRKKPALQKNAYPTVFPGFPVVLSYIAVNRPEPKPIAKLDVIKDFQDLQSHIVDKLKEQLDKKWSYDTVVDGTGTCIVLYIIVAKPDSAPFITVSVKVEPDMTLQVFVENVKVDDKHLDLIINNKLERWSQLENLLIYYNDYESIETNHRNSSKDIETQSNLQSAAQQQLPNNGTVAEGTETLCRATAIINHCKKQALKRRKGLTSTSLFSGSPISPICTPPSQQSISPSAESNM